MATTFSPAGAAPYHDARVLRIYAYYRTFLASLLLLLFTSAFSDEFLGTAAPQLFFYTACCYTFLNLATLLWLWWIDFSPPLLAVLLLLIIDSIALTLLMHGSMGIDLGYLLLITIAAGGIFLPGKQSLAIAGIATLLLLGETIYSRAFLQEEKASYFSTGVFGIVLFSTAFAFSLLSEKIRESTEEALVQAEQAQYLEKLSQLILERMRTGILVINQSNDLVLANRAARALLGISDRTIASIQEIEPISEQLQIWKAYPHTRSPHVKAYNDGPEIRISFAFLDNDHSRSDILVFVEDNRHLSQEAQQLKLASLGRLTASIAHEVRNPLGAISHAAQLLNESPDLSEPDQRLSEIIQNHSRRVNHIIENVLQLSRRKSSLPEPIDLVEWLPEFVNEFRQGKQGIVELQLTDDAVKTRIDLSQLQQVLTNLCDNGLRYSQERIGEAVVIIKAGVDKEFELPYIEVIDEGHGIPDSDIEQVFEPFFTTASTGSGLGLYISRELCEANQASLDYKRTESGKSCFRIALAHPQRIF